MEKINGIIIDGKVYAAVKDLPCKDCHLSLTCKYTEERTDLSLCAIHGATVANDFGYRHSRELTDKLNSK